MARLSQGADLAREDILVAIVVANGGQNRGIGGQRERGVRTALALEAAHKLGCEVLRLRRASPIPRDQYLMPGRERFNQPPGNGADVPGTLHEAAQRAIQQDTALLQRPYHTSIIVAPRRYRCQRGDKDTLFFSTRYSHTLRYFP